MSEEHFLLLGSRREHGKWAPDGAIGWIGSVRAHLEDLRPILLSSLDPREEVVPRCGFLAPGAVRFLPDGSFIIVPGVEPGAYLYGPDLKLQHAWQTDDLGFLDRCDIPEPQRLLYMRDPEARVGWSNRHAMLDDILPLPNGKPGLLVRRVNQKRTHWELLILDRKDPPVRVQLPFSAPSDVAYAKGDVSGESIAFLIFETGKWRKDATPSRPRLIIADWEQ